MADSNNFMMELLAALDLRRSKKQINTDIKQLEKTLGYLRLTATLYRGSSKKEIKQQIAQIQAQLAPLKLNAKLDEKAAQRSVNAALKNVKINDININVHGLKLKLQKALSDISVSVPRIRIPVDYEIKKQKLQNDLTTYLSKNSKIRESSALLKEVDKLRDLFSKVYDRESSNKATEQLKLFKSEVQATGFSGASTTEKLHNMILKISQIGSLFGVGAMMVNRFSDSLKTLRNNSTILTEIAKTSEMTARELKEVGDSSFSVASKYGMRSNGYLEGVREMARSGYDSLSKELGELSVLAQSAGDMTADSANNYLLATDAAYKYKGSIEALTAALDGANYISNRNSATLTDIADGVRVSASYAAEAGVQIDELTAAEATMIATTKRSGSEMGRAFRSILLNLQQVSGEFDGEVIDEESLKKVEDRCHSLGIELETLTDNGAKLRNPMDVLKELAKVYNSLPDNSVDKQGIISDIGGKYHANALAALLSNWKSYEKMLGEFSQGAGSSLKEAAKTADSWEGRLNALQNQWDSFVNHVTNQDAIKSGISFFDTAIGGAEKLVDTLGAIPTLLTAITGAYTALNKDYGITQIANPETGKLDLQGNYMGVDITALKAQRKHFKEAEEAIMKWNQEVASGMTDINDLGLAVVKNNAQLREYLATCTDGSASLAGYKASLRAAGVATETLRIKTVLMTSAISLGLGLAIQAGVSLLAKFIDEHVHAQERALEAAEEAKSRIKAASDTYSGHKNIIEECADAYERLSKGIDASTNKNINLSTDDYNKFLEINKQLADAFPQLITTVDENGNAILNLGKSGRSASEDLKELLKSEEDLQNFKISLNLGDLFSGVKVQIDKALQGQEKFDAEIKHTEDSLNKLKDLAGNKITIGDSIEFSGDLLNEGDAKYYEVMNTAVKNFYDSLLNSRRVELADSLDLSKLVHMNDGGTAFDLYLNASELSPDEKQTLERLIQEQAKTVVGSISDSLNQSIQEKTEESKEAQLAWKDFLANMVSGMKSQQTFKDLDTSMQEIATRMVHNLQMNVADEMDKNDPYSYIRDNIISPLTYLSEEDSKKLSGVYSKLFSFDTEKVTPDKAVEVINGYLDEIAALLDKTPLEIKTSFGFEGVDQLVEDFNNAISSSAQKFSTKSIKPEELSEELYKFFDEYSINTTEEISNWNQIVGEVTSAAEAMAEYARQKSIVTSQTETTSPFMDIPVEKLEEYISLLKSGTIDEKTISSYAELNVIMKETGLSAKEAVKSFKEFSDNYTLSSQLVSDMESVTELIAKTKDEIKQTGTLGTDSLSAIAKQFPELENAVSQFNQGLISTDDLILLLQSAYESDADAFRSAMVAKLSGNETFFDTIKNNNQGLFEDLAKAYGLDVSNWKSLAQAKAQIDQQLIQNLSAAWSKYYGTVVDAATGMTKLTGPVPQHGSSQGVAFSDPEQEKAYAAALDAVSKANALKRKLDEAAKIEIDVPDFSGIKPEGYKKSGSKEKKAKEPKTKDFDWIKRRQELLQKLHDQELEMADDESASYQTRIALIDELIAKDKERLAFNQDAAKSYDEAWKSAKAKIFEEAAKQGEDGDAIISSIMNGSSSNATYADGLADAVQEAVDIYDDLTANEEKSAEANKEIDEHLKKQLELKLSIAEAQTDILKAEADSLAAEIDLMEAQGKAVTEAQLREQIGLSEDLTDSYYDQIDALQEQLDNEKEGSAKYYSLRSAISQCEAAIADCAVQQAEWNDQIKRLPIERINKFLELMGYLKQDLQNFIDEWNSVGKNTTKDQFQELININLKQIEKLLEQQTKLSELLNDYEYGSTKYQETASDLQDIDNQISELIQSQNEWNQSILQIPINTISNLNETLQNAVSAMSELLSDYDAAISAVTGVLDKQIKAINDLKDATSEEYEVKLKPLQDQLDLLKKENEARRIQLELEQAKYDLDKAMSQKTNKVLRDGEFVYEADQDAIRSAQNSVNDADYNKTVHDLETQISALEEERDNLLEGYDKQIEKLDEIKDKWASITEEIKLAADSLKADEVLGTGWQDKITSGNDAELYNSLKDLYTTISNQKNQYEEQIASNERIADMMNQFMESWQNGSITYDQAMAGIRDLAAQMKDGYSSLEHLDAILGLNGATDLGTLLSQMQNSANASVDQFEDYMAVVKANADALEKYNSSWEEMQQNIKDQIAALEKLAEEAAKIAKSVSKHSSSGGGSSHSGPDTSDKTYVKNGPGATEQGLADAIEQGKEIREYHSGGIVKDAPDPNKFMGLISTKDLKPGEVYAKLKEDEYVLTEEQQYVIENNYRNLMRSAVQQPNVPITPRQQQPIQVNVTLGDLNFPKVTTVDEFARDMQRNFPAIMRQTFSTVFNH